LEKQINSEQCRCTVPENALCAISVRRTQPLEQEDDMKGSKDIGIRKSFRILAVVISLFAFGSAFMTLCIVEWQGVAAAASGLFTLIFGVDFAFIAWRGRGLLVWGRRLPSPKEKTKDTTEQRNAS